MSTVPAAGSTTAKTSLFSRVTSWFGKVALGALHIVNKGDQVVDADEPELVRLLEGGESIAGLFPGINVEAVPIINGSIELLGAAKATADGTVAIEPAIQAQINALVAGKGVNVVLVADNIWVDLQKLWKTYEAEFNVAKNAVGAIDPSALAKPVVSSPHSAVGNLTQAPGGEPLGSASAEVKAAIEPAKAIEEPVTETAAAVKETAEETAAQQSDEDHRAAQDEAAKESDAEAQKGTNDVQHSS
jgi:hypothetical protein